MTTPEPTPQPAPPNLVRLIHETRRAALTTGLAELTMVDLIGLRESARQVVERLDEWIAERRVTERQRPLHERLAAAGIPVPPLPTTGDPGE